MAASAWLDFINNTTLAAAKDLGLAAFADFMAAKSKVGNAKGEDADDGDDGESPLDEENSDPQVPAAAV